MRTYFIESTALGLVGGLLSVLVQILLPSKLLVGDVGALGSFVTAFATIYGVTLGFVIIEVWNQFRRTQALIDQEAAALEGLYNLTRYTKESQVIEQVREKIADYIRAIVERPLRNLAKETPHDGAKEQFAALFGVINQLILDSARDVVVFEQLVEQYRAFREVRTDRIRESNSRLPRPLKVYLEVASIITVGAFILTPFHNTVYSGLTAGVLTFLLTYVHIMIGDLDNPFLGYFNVEVEAFEEARKRMFGG